MFTATDPVTSVRAMAAVVVGATSGISGLVTAASGASDPTTAGVISAVAVAVGGAFWKWLKYNDGRADRALHREQKRAEALQAKVTQLSAENAGLKARLGELE